MARKRTLLTPEERNQHFISKILAPCPYDFKKEDGIWYKRITSKRNKNVWREIVFSEDGAANDSEGIY